MKHSSYFFVILPFVDLFARLDIVDDTNEGESQAVRAGTVAGKVECFFARIDRNLAQVIERCMFINHPQTIVFGVCIIRLRRSHHPPCNLRTEVIQTFRMCRSEVA